MHDKYRKRNAKPKSTYDTCDYDESQMLLKSVESQECSTECDSSQP